MGTQAQKVFEDPAFAPSLKHAQEAVFHACLGDLVVHMASMLPPHKGLADACATLLPKAVAAAKAAEMPGDMVADVRARLAKRAGAGTQPIDIAFRQSAQTIVDHAPVSEEIRKVDRRIIDASMRHHWIAVDRDLDKRLDRNAIAAALVP